MERLVKAKRQLFLDLHEAKSSLDVETKMNLELRDKVARGEANALQTHDIARKQIDEGSYFLFMIVYFYNIVCNKY